MRSKRWCCWVASKDQYLKHESETDSVSDFAMYRTPQNVRATRSNHQGEFVSLETRSRGTGTQSGAPQAQNQGANSREADDSARQGTSTLSHPRTNGVFEEGVNTREQGRQGEWLTLRPSASVTPAPNLTLPGTSRHRSSTVPPSRQRRPEPRVAMSYSGSSSQTNRTPIPEGASDATLSADDRDRSPRGADANPPPDAQERRAGSQRSEVPPNNRGETRAELHPERRSGTTGTRPKPTNTQGRPDAQHGGGVQDQTDGNQGGGVTNGNAPRREAGQAGGEGDQRNSRPSSQQRQSTPVNGSQQGAAATERRENDRQGGQENGVGENQGLFYQVHVAFFREVRIGLARGREVTRFGLEQMLERLELIQPVMGLLDLYIATTEELQERLEETRWWMRSPERERLKVMTSRWNNMDIPLFGPERGRLPPINVEDERHRENFEGPNQAERGDPEEETLAQRWERLHRAEEEREARTQQEELERQARRQRREPEDRQRGSDRDSPRGSVPMDQFNDSARSGTPRPTKEPLGGLGREAPQPPGAVGGSGERQGHQNGRDAPEYDQENARFENRSESEPMQGQERAQFGGRSSAPPGNTQEQRRQEARGGADARFGASPPAWNQAQFGHRSWRDQRQGHDSAYFGRRGRSPSRGNRDYERHESRGGNEARQGCGNAQFNRHRPTRGSPPPPPYEHEPRQNSREQFQAPPPPPPRQYGQGGSLGPNRYEYYQERPPRPDERPYVPGWVPQREGAERNRRYYNDAFMRFAQYPWPPGWEVDLEVTSLATYKEMKDSTMRFSGKTIEYRSFRSYFLGQVHNNSVLSVIQKTEILSKMLLNAPGNVISSQMTSEMSVYAEMLADLDFVYGVCQEDAYHRAVSDLAPYDAADPEALEKMIRVFKQAHANLDPRAQAPVLTTALRKIGGDLATQYCQLHPADAKQNFKTLSVFLHNQYRYLKRTEDQTPRRAAPIKPVRGNQPQVHRAMVGEVQAQEDWQGERGWEQRESLGDPSAYSWGEEYVFLSEGKEQWAPMKWKPEWDVCPLCKTEHFLVQCEKFIMEMEIDEKWALVNKLGRCTRCLGLRHAVADCPRKDRCFICRSPEHHSTLHRFKSQKTEPKSKTPDPKEKELQANTQLNITMQCRIENDIATPPEEVNRDPNGVEKSEDDEEALQRAQVMSTLPSVEISRDLCTVRQVVLYV